VNPVHHLDATSLMSHAAGVLPTAFAVVAATHLSVCAQCRAQLALAERIGGVLLGKQEPAATADHAREAMLELIKVPLPEKAAPSAPDRDHSDSLPAPLRPYFGESLSRLPWRFVAPGIRRVAAQREVSGGSLMLLSVAPGKSIPEHTHGKNEMTCILRGAYDDILGHFGPGDLADLDGETTHQPITSPGTPCICVAATDAPLRFKGWLVRTLQPLFNL